jgi:hypothetical protein
MEYFKQRCSMEPSELTDKAIDYILDGITVENLNDWERGFIESVNDQWHRKRSLSEKQKVTLGRIWDKQP